MASRERDRYNEPSLAISRDMVIRRGMAVPNLTRQIILGANWSRRRCARFRQTTRISSPHVNPSGSAANARASRRSPSLILPSVFCGLSVILTAVFFCTASYAQEKIPALDYGKTTEDAIATNQTKSLQIRLEDGQYAAVVVNKKEEFWTRAQLFNPAGEQELEVQDNGLGFTVSVLASAAGTYRLEIKRTGSAGGEGHYSVSLSSPRAASPEDKKRVAAERAYAQGELSADRSVSGLQARLPHYEAALALWRELGDRLQEASTLRRLGNVHGDLHETESSIAYTTKALSIAQSMGFRRIEVDCAQTLGAVYTNRGEVTKALGYFKEALAASREIQYKSGEAMALMSLGRNDPTVDALQSFRRALKLWQDEADPRGQAYALNSLGQKYMALGDEYEAFDSTNQSLELARATKDLYGEAYALQHLGGWSTMRGDLRQALDYLLQALPLQRQRGDAWGEAQALQDIASMYMCIGEAEKALEHAQQTLPLWKKVQNHAQEASAMVQIGGIYSALGDRETALTYFQQALAIQQSLN